MDPFVLQERRGSVHNAAHNQHTRSRRRLKVDVMCSSKQLYTSKFLFRVRTLGNRWDLDADVVCRVYVEEKAHQSDLFPRARAKGEFFTCPRAVYEKP